MNASGVSAAKESNDWPVKDVNVPASSPEMCQHCFDVIIKHLLGPGTIHDDEECSSIFLQSIPNTTKCPLFVTWEKINSHSSSVQSSNSADLFTLRGCIGTLSPRQLCMALGEYASRSAFRDHRFDPIEAHEITQLRVTVSLLVKYEKCSGCFDWKVGEHGIFIKFSVNSKNYNATFLPEIAPEQGWNQQEAIGHLVKKAGYREETTDSLIAVIECTRYQASKHRLTYTSYVSLSGSDPVKNAMNTVILKSTQGKR